MNLEGIFVIFSFFDENEPDKKIEQEIEEYTSTPYYKIKIFIKLIINGKTFKQQLTQFKFRVLNADCPEHQTEAPK